MEMAQDWQSAMGATETALSLADTSNDDVDVDGTPDSSAARLSGLFTNLYWAGDGVGDADGDGPEADGESLGLGLEADDSDADLRDCSALDSVALVKHLQRAVNACVHAQQRMEAAATAEDKDHEQKLQERALARVVAVEQALRAGDWKAWAPPPPSRGQGSAGPAGL